MANTRRALLILGLVMPLLALGACSTESSVPEFNACGWPGDCSPTANEIVSEVVSWAKADVQKFRINAGMFQRLVAHKDRIASTELTNKDDKHVCELENPDPCTELAELRDMARQAHGTADDTQARKLWAEVIAAFNSYPSGT